MSASPASTSSSLPFFERVSMTHDPYIQQDDRGPLDGSPTLGVWPCKWIVPAQEIAPPFVLAYRIVFHLPAAATLRLHVTADERYELFADGQRMGRGSERSEPNHWCFETYDVRLSAGEHVFAARVWTQGTGRAFAQMSSAPGFLLSPQAPEHQALLGTGVAAWETKRLEGYTFTNPMAAWGTGQNLMIDGALLDYDFVGAGGSGWTPAVPTYPGLSWEFCREQEECRHVLMPALLPPMLEEERFVGKVRHVAVQKDDTTGRIKILEADHLSSEAADWQKLLDERVPLNIPPRTSRRILIDLDEYYCAYPHVVTTRGKDATLRIHWQEALYDENEGQYGRKSNRDVIHGKHFITLWWGRDGVGDTFRLGGGTHRVHETLWWQAGRYVEVVVTTADEPLVIERLSFLETRYPMENTGRFKTQSAEMNDLVPILVRALQMCSHETYMDCPFYEQLAYIGDARLEALVTYVSTTDSRLARKSLHMFDLSRIPSGLTQSRYPSKTRQMIPPFTLWWVCMVYDYALWRGDAKFVRSLMPGVRIALDAFRAYDHPTGLVGAAPGWNFVDWMSNWPDGVPPDGAHGVTASINWQVVLAAQAAAQTEEWIGEPELAARARRWAAHLVEKIEEHLWDEKRGLYADDLGHQHFSMHTQILALLSGAVPAERARTQLLPSLAKGVLPEPSIYFRHYLFEALQSQNVAEEIIPHLDLWLRLRGQGFKTTFEAETPETARSDCHGWASHPLYHYYASLAGIRPSGFGFESFTVRPALQVLGWAEGELPHPRGYIRFRLDQTAETLTGWIEPPDGLTGTVYFAGQEQRIEGRTTLSLKAR